MYPSIFIPLINLPLQYFSTSLFFALVQFLILLLRRYFFSFPVPLFSPQPAFVFAPSSSLTNQTIFYLPFTSPPFFCSCFPFPIIVSCPRPCAVSPIVPSACFHLRPCCPPFPPVTFSSVFRHCHLPRAVFCPLGAFRPPRVVICG